MTTYSPSPRPSFDGPAAIPYASVTRHIWGDPEAGEVADWIYASTERVHALVFGLAPGAGACTLAGYPGVDTGAGGPLVHAQRLPRGYMGGLAEGSDEPPVVTVSPTESAHAIVEGLAVDENGNQCPTYTDLRVTPPDTTETSTVPTTIDVCMLIVHPVIA